MSEPRPDTVRSSREPSAATAAEQRWPWWPLLPLYPYGRRRTLVRQLIPGRLWTFDQVQGVWYVAVPIRMTVVRLGGGLLLYAPVAPTAEVLAALRDLESRHGPVRTIVLPTTSGLEHKLPTPAMARAFPQADLWVSPHQWSFPVPLPLSWLGFPAARTRVLFDEGLPHADELDWCPLGPLDLGLGTFMEVACFHRASGSLLLADALVAIPSEPPEVFDLDPTPLLFHGRERADEGLADSPERRRRGWRRLVLFANFLRPDSLDIAFGDGLRGMLPPGCRGPRCHFGFYPFRWRQGWEVEAEGLLSPLGEEVRVAPVLERLVFPRFRAELVAWVRRLAELGDVRWIVPAHYHAPVATSPDRLRALADVLEARPWAPSGGSWAALAGIDRRLQEWGVVPRQV